MPDRQNGTCEAVLSRPAAGGYCRIETERTEVQAMATYECAVCGMAVNATCAKCDAPLVNDILKLDDGSEVQVSRCPNGHGKIKSPMCCGQDMVCTAA
jgi:hypothetical protein